MKTEKLRIRSTLNFDPKKDISPENTVGASLTVPDESYSIKELINRHQNGLPINLNVHGEYEDEVDFDDHDREKISSLDLTEIDQIMETNKQLMLKLKQALDEQKKPDLTIDAKERQGEKEEEIPKTDQEPKKE